MKAYIEILSNNGVDFPRPLVEKWPDVSPTTPAHIVAELFASWVLENIGDEFSFRCIAHAGRDVYPFTVSTGDEII